MLTDKRFDFSLETDLKERLWGQMLQRTKETTAVREEVKLESLTGQPKSIPQTSRNLPRKEPDKTL